MNGTMKMLKVLLATALVLTQTTCAFAQDKQPRKMIEGQLPYAHSTEGIQKQFDDVLQSFREGRKEEAQALLSLLCLQEPEDLAASFYTGENPEKSFAQYKVKCQAEVSDMGAVLEMLGKATDGKMRISRGKLVTTLPAGAIETRPSDVPGRPALETFRFEISGYGKQLDPFQEVFVYADGAFRHLFSIPGTGIPVPPHSPPQRIRIGGNVMVAKVVSKVTPQYPPEALQKHFEGTVRLQIIIAKDGAVLEAQVLSGDPVLTKAALEAVRQWRYDPTTLNGQRVEVATTVDVIFTLPKNLPAP